MKTVAIIICIAALFLCGCDAGYSRISAGSSGFDCEMYVIQNSIPYTGGVDIRLDSIKLLETDDYGRKLFYYRMTLSHLGILFIVQNVAEPVAYYYENDFYILRKDATNLDDFTDEDKMLIKERNDWNQPLRTDKMYSVTCTESAYHENIPNYLDTVNAVTQEAKKYFPQKDWSSTRITLNGLETYQGIGQVALLIINSDTVEPEYYIVLFNPTSSPAIRAISPAGDIDDFRESIIAFKNIYCNKNG